MDKKKLIKWILGILLGIVCLINGYYIFNEILILFFILTVIGGEIIFILFAINDYESHNHFGIIAAIKVISLVLSAFMSCIASIFVQLFNLLIDKWMSLIYIIGVIILLLIYIYLNKKLYNKISG